MPICKKCNNRFPNRKKINGKIKVLNSRKYCLECSPFGKHNTWQLEKTKYKKILIGKVCPKCKIHKEPNDYYKRRNNTDISTYCKICTISHTIVRQRKFKQLCIEYMGEKCKICKYNKCDSALEFHHLDPNKKDFSISHVKLKTFSNNVKEELDKCIMLCANCHREIHDGTKI